MFNSSLQVDPVVLVTKSVVSLLFSDHNTQQTHSNNSDSNAEEDIQVQQQKLRLFVHPEARVSTNPVLFCLISLKRNEYLFHLFTITQYFTFPQASVRPLL